MTQLAYPAVRRAAVLSDFGEAGNLSIRELPMPPFRSNEMLVRVKATSVNPIEWKMRRGLGLPKPIWRRLIGRPMILGIDFSGTVVAVGPEVKGYRIGDDVMGAFRLWGADALLMTEEVYEEFYTYALNVVAEAIGSGTTVVILPFVNTALAARQPFHRAVVSLQPGEAQAAMPALQWIACENVGTNIASMLRAPVRERCWLSVYSGLPSRLTSQAAFGQSQRWG